MRQAGILTCSSVGVKEKSIHRQSTSTGKPVSRYLIVNYHVDLLDRAVLTQVMISDNTLRCHM